MARKRAAQKPRSPMTDSVFEAFVAALRAEPTIGEEAAIRMQAALSPGQSITVPKLREALFAAEESATK